MSGERWLALTTIHPVSRTCGETNGADATADPWRMPLWSGGDGRMIGLSGVMAIVRAFVLIQTESGKTGRVAQEIATIQGVSSAVVVTGPYDIIAVVQAASIDSLGKMVVSRIQGVKGITRTLTCPVVHI